MATDKIIISDIKSVFGFSINIGKNRVLYLFTRVKVFADSADSVSYCLFTILTNKAK